jgi:hypothetical protein
MTITEKASSQHGNRWRIGAWSAAAALLVIPFFAMRFTNEVDWSARDFLLAALLIGIPGLVLEGVVRLSGNLAYRAGATLALLAAGLIVWINGAVGIIGSENNPTNLIFAGVIAVAAIGACIARGRAGGLRHAMIAAAAAQAATGVIAFSLDMRVIGFIAILTVVWLIAAALFARAAAQTH